MGKGSNSNLPYEATTDNPNKGKGTGSRITCLLLTGRGGRVIKGHLCEPIHGKGSKPQGEGHKRKGDISKNIKRNSPRLVKIVGPLGPPLRGKKPPVRDKWELKGDRERGGGRGVIH